MYLYLCATLLCVNSYVLLCRQSLCTYIYARCETRIPTAIMRVRPSRIINRSRLVHSLVNTLGYYNCSIMYHLLVLTRHRRDLF